MPANVLVFPARTCHFCHIIWRDHPKTCWSQIFMSARRKICEKMGGATLSGRTLCFSIGTTLGARSLFLPHNVAAERGQPQGGKKGKKGHAMLCGRTFWVIVLYLQRFWRNLRHIIWRKSAMIWFLSPFGDMTLWNILAS